MEIQPTKGVVIVATKVQRWGNSLGIRIPQQVAENLGIAHGSMMEMKSNHQQIILKPMKSKPSLEELVSKITEENRHAEIDFGKPVGNELW